MAATANPAGKPMNDDEGIKLIKAYEGLRLTAYQDAVGIWTIGYGCTSGVCEGMSITEEGACLWLMREVKNFETLIELLVTVPLTSNQLSALVSFVYNVGGSAFESSTLLKKLNKKDYLGAADEFLRWNKAKGKVLPGLTKRREAERKLFLKSQGGDLLNEERQQTKPIEV